jgi:hypothetical protein
MLIEGVMRHDAGDGILHWMEYLYPNLQTIVDSRILIRVHPSVPLLHSVDGYDTIVTVHEMDHVLLNEDDFMYSGSSESIMGQLGIILDLVVMGVQHGRISHFHDSLPLSYMEPLKINSTIINSIKTAH